MKSRYIIFGMLLALTAGCQQDSFEGFNQDKGEVRVFASMASTRVAFADGGNVTHAVWENGDQIVLFTDTQDSLLYTASVATDGGTATEFTPDGNKLQNEGNGIVRAFYPAGNLRAEEAAVSIPNTADYIWKEGNYCPFVYAQDTIQNGVLNLNFQHPFAYIKLTVTKDVLPQEDESDVLGEIVITSAEKIGLTSGEFNFEKKEITSDSYSNTITVAISEHIHLSSKDFVCYIPILPQAAGTSVAISTKHTAEEVFYTLEKETPGSGLLAGNVYEVNLDGSNGITLQKSAVVDLGLSVKWLNYNTNEAGETNPETYGDLYGWGDASGQKTSTDLDAYPFANPISSISGTTYDPTYKFKPNFGGDIRMPTQEEITELYEKCTWKWVTYKQVDGYLVTGPNGNSIFLPAAGYRNGTEICNRGTDLNYWSGTLKKESPNEAYRLFLAGESKGVTGANRYFGYSVRAVYENPSNWLPTIGYCAMSNDKITAHTALFVAAIEHTPDAILEKGVCYSTTNAEPTVTDSRIQCVSESDSIVCKLENLSEYTTYYFATYAINKHGITYNVGNPFTTDHDITLTEGDAIDLGLSVKWASCNLEASLPEEFGGQYGWADTTGTAKWEVSSYVDYPQFPYPHDADIWEYYGGFNPPPFIQDTELDLAKKRLGEYWRLPTREEARELRDNCTWKPVKYKGIKGALITGSNGNNIFLPAAGYGLGGGSDGGIECVSKYYYNSGELGIYWTGELCISRDYCAYDFSFQFGDIDNTTYYIDYSPRDSHQSIRPVFWKQIPESEDVNSPDKQ